MSEAILQLNDFTPFLNQAFTAEGPQTPLCTLKLVKAAYIKTWSLADSSRKAFHLMFQLTEGEFTQQEIVTLTHLESGKQWNAFSVPVLNEEPGTFIEVIFN